jgi:cell division protein FtsB
LKEFMMKAGRQPHNPPKGGAGATQPNSASGTTSRKTGLMLGSVLIGVMLLISFVVIYPTARQYLTQRHQIAAAQAELEQSTQLEADLAADLERWNDPAYVQAQARTRLLFVMPGETAYRVVDPESVPTESPSADPTGSESLIGLGDEPPVDPSGIPNETNPWFVQIWQSVKVADQLGN